MDVIYSVLDTIAITLAFLVPLAAYMFRPEWFTVPGADPISWLIRERRRARYGDRYK